MNTRSLVDRAIVALNILPHESLVVDFRDSLRGDVLRSVTSLGIQGVVVSEEFKLNARDDNTIGLYKNDGTWKLPPGDIKAIIVLGNPEQVGLKMLLSLMRRKINTLSFIDAVSHHSVGVKHLFAQHLCRRGQSWFAWHVDGVANSALNMLGRYSATRFCIRPNFMRPKATHHELEERCDSMFMSKRVQTVSAKEGKIVLINNGLAPGGAERQFVNTALGLRKNGLEVHIVVLKSGDKYFDFYRPILGDSIPVHNLYNFFDGPTRFEGEASSVSDCDMREFANYKELLPEVNWEEIARCAAVFRALEPHYVHAWQDSTSISAGVAAVLLGIKRVILSTRNMAPHRFAYHQAYMKPVYRALLKQPNVAMVNNSQQGAIDYAEWLGIPIGNVSVVRNGNDPPVDGRNEDVTAFARRYGLSREHKTTVGAVFRFWPEKDPMLWLKVATLLTDRHPNLQLVLIGDGPLKPEMELFADTCGLKSRLVLPGYLEDPIPAVLCMDVFLMTSLYEGTPNVLIEAQMAGVPVVATDAGGCRDVITDGVTGYIVPDRNPVGLADKISLILSDPALRSKMSSCAAELARAKFGVQNMIADTLKAYAWK
jgi:glycosyltransferase involved in cell wall biosynthesis